MENFVEILCVGNELLIGKTTNTNAQWLAKRITTLGMKVRRVTVVGDDVNEISTALKEIIKRKPVFIITTGGLGPTFDDKTLEGVAKAINRGLVKNEEALRMIEEKYRKYVAEGEIERYELTPYRVKMAMIPEGSKPLCNPVGTAPGVLVKYEGITLVMLPGVPSEMKAIFDEFVAPLIRKVAGDLTFYEVSIDVWGIPESELAPYIDEVMHDNPYVYIKSHPKAAEKIPHLELHLSTTSKDADLARQIVSKALIQISEIAREKGGKIKPIKTD